ncbi:MAG: 16S rRNA (uracil(1498)-N(3))-methyltransferase [Spirochaetia bacterium]|nr:16S rRNA (uracil(1498)-N(3))-methyltransferase [Spirochaetia bacterium]
MQELNLRNDLLVFVSTEDFISIQSGKSISLDSENIHHIRRVLRYDDDVVINVSAGDGKLIIGKLSLDNKIEKLNDRLYEISRNVKTSLINPGIKRKNLDYLIQKSTEIGVDLIHFISSNYQNYPVENKEKYKKTALNACIQSKNPFIPVIETHSSGIIDFPFREDVFYFWGDPDQETSIEKLKKSDIEGYTSICFINGPEGGWSPVESEFLKNRFRSVRLSDNVLRTETAALAALFYIKLLTGNSKK